MPQAPTPVLVNTNDVVELGEDEYFLLGDNSRHSLDSRYFGPVVCEAPYYVLYPASDSARLILDSLEAAVRRELYLD